MANEILRSCKKYIVERVVTPGVYCVSEYERGKAYKQELERLEYLLGKNVEKLADAGKIMTGEMIAVKDEEGFHRGLVNDVFNRGLRATYCILLFDYGNIIETDGSHIYLIKNENLINRKLGAFEVSIHGIQPVLVNLDGDNNFMGGILQKRVSGNWSPKAFHFVRSIMEKNPCVFVKSVKKNKRAISGEIYFIEEPGGVLVSLGEKLCVKGFAVTCDTSSRFPSQDSLQGDSDTGIEEKIPYTAFARKVENSEALQNFKSPERERSKICNFNDSSNVSIFSLQYRAESESTNSSESSVFQSLSVDTCPQASFSSNSVNYSSSWILKKCQSNTFTSSSPCDTFKMGTVTESKQKKTGFPTVCNENTFKVVLRSMELFDKKKEIERFYCK